MLEQLSVIFVSVGKPSHGWALYEKTEVTVDLKNGQTIIQAAKLYRKKIAEVCGVKPSQLWFEIYRTPDAVVPMYRNWLRMEMF